MGMVVRTNTMALNAYRQLGMNNSAVSKSLEKLSSGFRINRAGDDAAGLAISEKMKAQITGLETAAANAQDGISLIQTAEGNLTEVHDMLNRMVELATKSANGTYTQTERDALQSEVNALLEEIDRISESANFNGTNLLDGSMGLNTEAFSFETVKAVEQSDGTIDISALVAKEADGSPKVHMESTAKTGKDPAGVIDLGDLQVAVGAGKKATATFTIAGQDIAVELDNSADTTNAKTFTTAEIATALVTALQKSSLGVDKTTGAVATGGVGDNDAIKLGNGVYSLTAGATTALTYEGYVADDGTFTAKTATAGEFTAEQAENLNKGLGFSVDIKSITDGERKGTYLVHAAQTDHAQAKVDAGLAGIDITLTEDLLENGSTITIDGVTLTVRSDPKDTATYTANTDLDIRNGKDNTERLHMLVDALSKRTELTGKDSRKWKIGVKDDKTIHLEQTAATGTGKDPLNTYDKLVDVISAKGKSVDAANIGTTIKVTNANVKDGDVLDVDGKKYVFTDDKKKLAATGTDVTYVAIKGGAAKNLAAKISGSKFDEDKNTVTVRAANEDDDAPVVLGGGLTLQIGDTADDFNKMTVLVKDMSTAGLGLKGLSIESEASASNAIDTIKKAITSVSTARADMGALQNRLDHTINNLDVAVENLSAANSRIRDTDMAKEMMNYTKMNVLVQSAQAMLAQANQQPQSVLQLLQ